MSDVANFVLGLIVGISSMVVLVVLWAMLILSGRISREEERRDVDHRPD